MPRTTIAQISDPHVHGPNEAGFEGATAPANLRAALAHASRRCDAVVLTGDLARTAGTDAEYEGLAAILDEATIPVHLCAGNHDDPAKMQRLFGVPSVNGRCDYVAALGTSKLIVLDTSRSGREEGEFSADQGAWLATQLSDGVPALVVMHHPVTSVGGPALESIRLDSVSRGFLAEALIGTKTVAISAGHAHLTCASVFAGIPAFICPSSAYEFGFGAGQLLYRPGPAQYMEFSWGDEGSDFLARVVTVADDGDWLVMD